MSGIKKKKKTDQQQNTMAKGAAKPSKRAPRKPAQCDTEEEARECRARLDSREVRRARRSQSAQPAATRERSTSHCSQTQRRKLRKNPRVEASGDEDTGSEASGDVLSMSASLCQVGSRASSLARSQQGDGMRDDDGVLEMSNRFSDSNFGKVNVLTTQTRNTSNMLLGKRPLSTVTEEFHESHERKRYREVNVGASCSTSERHQFVDVEESNRREDTMIDGQKQVVEQLVKITRLLEELVAQNKEANRQMRVITETTGLQQVHLESIQANITKKTTSEAPLYTNLETTTPAPHATVTHARCDENPTEARSARVIAD